MVAIVGRLTDMATICDDFYFANEKYAMFTSFIEWNKVPGCR